MGRTRRVGRLLGWVAGACAVCGAAPASGLLGSLPIEVEVRARKRMSTLNTARPGCFSSDRAIREYAESIWRITPVPVEVT